MKAKFFRRLSPLLLASLASCATSGGVRTQDHWHVGGVGARAKSQLLDVAHYKGESTIGAMCRQYRELALTAKRHFLSIDPTNPLQRSFFTGKLRLNSEPLHVPKPPPLEDFEVNHK